MFAQALIALSVALNSSQSAQIEPPTDLTSFRIEYPTGAIVRKTVNGFGAIGFLNLWQTRYEASNAVGDPWFELTDNGRTIVTPPVRMKFETFDLKHKVWVEIELQVSRKIYIPLPEDLTGPVTPGGPDDAYRPPRNYVRYYDVIENLGPAAAIVPVQFWGLVGLPDMTSLGPASDGWAVIKNEVDYDNWRVGCLFTRGIPDGLWNFTFAWGMPAATYFIPMQPGDRVALLNFVALKPMPTWPDPLILSDQIPLAEAGNDEEFACQLEEMAKHPDLDCLSDDEIYQIWNLYIDTDVNLDGRVNILDLIFVRNRIGEDPQSGDNVRADCNHDDKINILDLIAVRNDIGWPF